MLVAVTLEDRFNAVIGRRKATHAELVDLTVEALRGPGNWGSQECHTVDKYDAWQAGLQIAVARKVVQIARRVNDLPLCVAALRSGLLSLDQMAPIAKRVPRWADAEICRQAKLMTVEQIVRTASQYPWDTDIPKPDGTLDNLQRPQPDTDPACDDAETDEPADNDGPAPDPEPLDTVAFWWDDQQRFHLHGDLDEATGSIIGNALTEARDGLFQNGQTDVEWADALLDVAERSLDGVESPARPAVGWSRRWPTTSAATRSAPTCSKWTVYRSRWGVASTPFPNAPVAPSTIALAAAVFPDVMTVVGSMCTTSCTGPKAVRPIRTI